MSFHRSESELLLLSFVEHVVKESEEKFENRYRGTSEKHYLQKNITTLLELASKEEKILVFVVLFFCCLSVYI